MSNPNLSKLLERLAKLDEVPDPFVSGYARRLRVLAESFTKAIREGSWDAASDDLLQVCRVSQILRLEVGNLRSLDEKTRSIIEGHLRQVTGCISESSGFFNGLSAKTREWAEKAYKNIQGRLDEVSVGDGSTII